VHADHSLRAVAERDKLSNQESTQGHDSDEAARAPRPDETVTPVTGAADVTGVCPELDATNGPSSAPLPEIDLPPFVGADYSNFITGSGAEKLAASGVAPLVAAARGYKRLDS